MSSLTTHLLSLDEPALQQATTHPFLKAAATSTLPTSKLQNWLGQDRLYQLAYVNFISSMLSHLPIPSDKTRSSTPEWRAASFLIDALVNIRQEMHLFESTAADEGFLEEICSVTASVPTRAYQDLFAGATAQGRPLLVGLTVLWATEECYLRAWRFARDCIPPTGSGTTEGEGDVMRRAFIPAWTSTEFEAFVKRIRDLVDELGEGKRGGEEWRECEVAFRQVLWAEREFWPDV